jgi:DNA-binding MarR family transcriptional regulator
MKHEPIAFPPTSPPHSKAAPPTSHRCADLSATILAQDQIIDRETGHVLSGRLEFDILLALYLAEHQGSSPCLSDICSATSAPFSTAHRKITGMIDRGLLRRSPPSSDRRRAVVQLGAGAKALVERTLGHLVERGN